MKRKITNQIVELDVHVSDEEGEQEQGRNISLPPSESVDKTNRVEQPWESRSEGLLLRWNKETATSSTAHERAAKKNKFLFRVFGLPPAILPALIAILSPYIPDGPVVVILLILSSIFSTIGQFFDFGGKTQSHYEYQHKFHRYAIEATSILTKPKRFRRACDVTMERMKILFTHLNGGAPPI